MKKITFLLVALIAVSFWAFKPNESNHQGLHIGEMAPDFNLKNVDGKMYSLKDIKASKGYIVIFTCNHCPFSKAYEDRIIAIDKKYKSQGFPVVAINPNDPAVNEEDSFEKMKERAKQKKFTFPYLFDEGQKVFPLYGATKTPHVFLLEKTAQGNKVAYIGAIDDNSDNPKEVKEKYLENALDALLKGEKPNPAQTKAIGCSIKVKK